MNGSQHGHYSDIRGVKGIVESSVIWATNIRYLNDENEYQHALDLIADIIPAYNVNIGSEHNARHQEFIEKLKRSIDFLRDQESESIFTVSFSQNVDLLSQWRGYCPNNNGYCMIYEVSEIVEAARNSFESVNLFECVYEFIEKEKHLTELLNRYWLLYINAELVDDLPNIMNQLVSELSLLATYFKHPSFIEERESRIVVNLPPGTKEKLRYREGDFSIVPYLEINAPRAALRKLIVGPTPDKELSKRSMSSFLKPEHRHMDFMYATSVECSQVPYRSI